MDAATLIAELEPTVERSLEQHLASAKEWFPHELVPWSRACDYVAGETWDAGQVELDGPVRSALFVNLLTEDNLPYYTSTITSLYKNSRRGWRITTPASYSSTPPAKRS